MSLPTFQHVHSIAPTHKSSFMPPELGLWPVLPARSADRSLHLPLYESVVLSFIFVLVVTSHENPEDRMTECRLKGMMSYIVMFAAEFGNSRGTCVTLISFKTNRDMCLKKIMNYCMG